MTDAQLARLSLIAARRRILLRQNSMVCLALTTVAENHPLRARACYKLKLWINSLLGGLLSYDIWISTHHKHLVAEPIPYGSCLEMTRQGRIAWIDWMLTQDLGEVMKKY
jgi:hypothetical protein